VSISPREVSRFAGDARVTTLSKPLTPDDYRAQVVAQLKACTDPAQAAALLGDVQTMLAATQASSSLQHMFWKGFSQDLDLLTQHAALLDPGAAATLRAGITAARGMVARALRHLKDV
jgi:hypothetical protein